jgi:hypothetical protein
MRVVEQENDLHGKLWTARRTVQVSTITQYQKAGRHIYVHTFDRHHSLIRPHNIQTHIAMRRLWSLNFAPTIFTHCYATQWQTGSRCGRGPPGHVLGDRATLLPGVIHRLVHPRAIHHPVHPCATGPPLRSHPPPTVHLWPRRHPCRLAVHRTSSIPQRRLSAPPQ